MTLIDVYRISAHEGSEGEKARTFLLQADWLGRMAEFDPRSGEALTQSLTPFLRKVAADAHPVEGWRLRDRLSRLVDHCRFALTHVLQTLNESPQREHAEMPVRNVRELDAACFRKLSSRPGRTIREKLAAKPNLLAVRRYQSVDLPENRLVKAFAMRLVELLKARAECLGVWLGECPDDLVDVLERWLRSDVARTISQWNNPPPNNVLLAHRDYRRIYDSWRWLQSLDVDTDDDFARLDTRQSCMEFWQYAAELRFHRNVLLAEVPIGMSYDTFSVDPLSGGRLPVLVAGHSLELPLGDRLEPAPRERPEDPGLPVVTAPVCVDFSGESPVYSVGGNPEPFPATLAWQLWETPKGRAEQSLFEAQVIYEGDGVTTIRPSDFIKSPDAIGEYAQPAAMSLANDFRRVFRNDSLVWLVPDGINDFLLTPLRLGINAAFDGAEPIPRSVAAAVQQVDLAKVGKGFVTVVIDCLGEAVFATRLVARFDAKLAKALPDETHGFAWERQPAVQIDPSIVQGCHVDENRLRKAIGPFAYVIFLRAAPVRGGFLLHEREQRVHDAEVPLWYDQLPELSTRIPVNGIYGRFYFVAKRHARISPRRGVAKPILVEQEFTLPPGRTIYEFPLYMGEGGASQFVATLKSSAFPLKKAIRCALKMTYTYGDSQPYNLVFHPLDGELKPVTVVWERKDRATVSPASLPVPDFSVRYGWNDLEANGTLEAAAHAFEEMHAYMSGDGNAGLIAVKKKHLEENVGRMKRQLQKLRKESQISLAQKQLDKLSGADVQTQVLYRLENIRKSCRRRILNIWDNARSCREEAAPAWFRERMENVLQEFESDFHDKAIPPEFKSVLAEMLYPLHKDIPAALIEADERDRTERGIDAPSVWFIGFALGDVTADWQRNMLTWLLARAQERRYFIPVLRSFSLAFWRNERFVLHLRVKDCRVICATLNDSVKWLFGKIRTGGLLSEQGKLHVLSLSTYTFEAMLALIRTRKSPNAEVARIFVPGGDIANKLLELVDAFAKVLSEHHLKLFSRISLQIDKPESLKGMPDLLYALRLYLSGDDGANTIAINEVSDVEIETREGRT